MIPASLARAVNRLPGFGEYGAKVGQAIHTAVLSGGEGARDVVDVLHGTWLGHPLHPALTDVPIGAWSLTAFFDVVALVSKSEQAERTADALNTAAVVVAVPTALAGIADYSTIDQTAQTMGAAHGLLNSVGLVLSICSLRDRAAGNRGRGVLLSTVSLGILTFSAWLGGEMVYRYKIGVDHEAEVSGPDEWTAAMNEGDLPDRTPKRAEVNGVPVLLYREGDAIYAIGAVCSHVGGPLDEGVIQDHCVECPWHQSVFDLRDGSIVHGPATYPEPAYAARIRDGRVEIHAWQPA